MVSCCCLYDLNKPMCFNWIFSQILVKLRKLVSCHWVYQNAKQLYITKTLCWMWLLVFCVPVEINWLPWENDLIECIMYAVYPFDMWTMCYVCWVYMLNQLTKHDHAYLTCNGMKTSIHQWFSVINGSFQSLCKHLFLYIWSMNYCMI